MSKESPEMRQRTVAAQLAKILGVTPSEGDIAYAGTKFSLPTSYLGREMEAPRDLLGVIKAQEEEIFFSTTMQYRPLDVAVTLHRTMHETFGMVKMTGSDGWFGRNRPHMMEVNVGFKETVQVPAPGDWIEVPSLERTEVMVSETNHPDLGPLGQVVFKTPKKNEDLVKGLCAEIERRLKESSIYKGHAITAAPHNPDFLDFSKFDPSKVVYSRDTRRRLEAAISLRIRRPDLIKRAGLDLKYSVLLPGVYGSGKSLYLALAGKEAQENGWTYLMVRAGKDDLNAALQTARLYQPCVVVFEDLDTYAGANSDQDSVTKVLDAFDGIQSKHHDIITLMTTNHAHDLHKGMLRAGRLDNIIEIGLLDREANEELFRVLVGDRLAEGVDFDSVYEVSREYVPAFIKESIGRAVGHALSRNVHLEDDEALDYRLDTEDLILGLLDVKPQIDLHNNAEDHGRYEPPLDRVFRTMIQGVVRENLSAPVAGGRPITVDPEPEQGDAPNYKTP
jgi:hypothetical protein